MIKMLERYIAIDTSYPSYDYNAAIALFISQARAEGLNISRITLSSGLPALIITLAGSDSSLPALALNHHMDVVAACRQDGWINDPFTATIRDGVLIGRGTQDMKGVGVIHFAALCAFKKQHGTPQRTIHLIMVPHEEMGGFQGTACLLNHALFKDLRVGYVVDEGIPSNNKRCLYVVTAQRAPLLVRITARGATAHAASLAAQNPVHELIEVMHTLVEKHRAQQAQAVTADPGLLYSYNITSLTAGSDHAANVIPTQASAIVDIRIPPETDFESVTSELSALCASRTDVTYEIRAQGITGLPTITQQNPLYQAIAQAAHTHGLTTKPHCFQATSDARFYLQQAITAIGFTPLTCAPNLHGINESVLIEDLERGKEIMLTLLELFCKK